MGIVFALVLQSPLSPAHDWHEPSALDVNALHERPLTPEESTPPKPGCVPALCLREIRDLSQTLDSLIAEFPDGPEGKASPWFARIQSARKDAVALGASLSVNDCIKLAESLSPIIEGFEQLDGDYPRTAEYAACVLATKKVGITMSIALGRYLEEQQWVIKETECNRLCLASLLANVYGGADLRVGIRMKLYPVRISDLFILSPEWVFRFFDDPAHAGVIGNRYSDWLQNDINMTIGLLDPLSDGAPEPLQKKFAADRSHAQSIHDALQKRIAQRAWDSLRHDGDFRHQPGALSKDDRNIILGLRNEVALDLGRGLHCHGQAWFVAHQEVLAGLNQAAASGKPDSILDMLPIWRENGMIVRSASGEDSDNLPIGLPSADNFSIMANSVMIQYLEDTKGAIPAHRMRQLLAGCLFQSGSCQEGFTPFHLTPFDLLVLHPDGYLACIKSLSPFWVAAMPQYDLESLKSDKHGRDIADDDKFWENHFKERFAKDRDKIESTLKAASRWLREQTAK